MTDSEFLNAVSNRFVEAFGENPSANFVLRLQKIANKLDLPVGKINPESDEWKVGDKVAWETEALLGRVLAVNGNKIWVKDSLGSYLTCNKESAIKYKLENEALHCELLEIANRKHPQGLVAEIMSKYNVTKKQ